MQHDLGFTGSHWMPPLGDYSLRIAQAVARATINSTMMQHVPTLLAVLMAIAMQRYYTARIAIWRRFVAFKKATKHHHRTSMLRLQVFWQPRLAPYRLHHRLHLALRVFLVESAH
jgi:hypothetical protein